jgi:putative ABC transport system permease protein
MIWLRVLLSRFGALFCEKGLEQRLEDELKSHLEMLVEENLKKGMSAEEARYAALRSFGGIEQTKETYRQQRGLPFIESLAQDLRYALRTLRRNPGFAAVAVLTLALGIGANTAIFSAVNALLLNPYPFPQPDRIMFVDARHASGKNSGAGYRDFLDWQEQNSVFDEMAIVARPGTYTLTGQGEPQRIIGGGTTAGFLRVLGVQPILGRFFTAEEDKPGAAPVAVLSYAAWQRRFAGSVDVLRRTMTLDGEPFTIIGVLPSRFALPGIPTCEFFTALRESPSQGRMQHQYIVIARLKPGITLERAQGDMTTIARRLEQAFPETNIGWGVVVMPIQQALAEETKTPMVALFSAVLFVLLLACANVAALQLARASGRAKEMASRASLGASRRRIARQMLTESVALALAGGGLGLVFARWLMNVLVAAAPSDFALDATLRIDPQVLVFTLVISVFTGVVFGVVPAWYGSKTDLNAAIKGDANAWSGARSRNRFLSCLIAGEVALSLVLLVGAGLLVKDLLFVLDLETGLRVEHVLTFALDPPYAKYSSPQRSTAFYEELLTSLRRAPGVEAAAAVGTLPMTGGYSGGPFEIEGRPKPADWMDADAQYNTSTPGYFPAMGIPLLRGRDFDERDTASALSVAIVNDTFARQFFPHEDPLGHRIKVDANWQTIIGVVGSVKHQKPMNAPVPMIYSPHAQSPWPYMWVTVRATGDPAKLAATARAEVRAIDPDIPILKLRTMRQVVADSLSEPRLLASFLAGFAGFALALACVGIYGIIAYSVTQRMHEMGVRVALGASRSDVLALVLRKGAWLAGVGMLVGIPAALAISRLMSSLLYGISPRDLTVFAGVPVLLVMVALAASYIPARRAAKVDPTVALRYE